MSSMIMKFYCLDWEWKILRNSIFLRMSLSDFEYLLELFETMTTKKDMKIRRGISVFAVIKLIRRLFKEFYFFFFFNFITVIFAFYIWIFRQITPNISFFPQHYFFSLSLTYELSAYISDSVESLKLLFKIKEVKIYTKHCFVIWKQLLQVSSTRHPLSRTCSNNPGESFSEKMSQVIC